MLYAIAIGLAIVLVVLVILPGRGTGKPGINPISAIPTVDRPTASQWSKNTAADILDEIALADERAKVLETMRRAVAINSPSSPADAAPANPDPDPPSVV